MPSLLDVLGTPNTVTINGNEVPVYGVSFSGIAALFRKFPFLQEMFKGGEIKIDVKDLDVEVILEKGPDCVAAVLAAMLGEPGNGAIEEAAGRLGLSKQVEIIQIGKELTMPDGLSPFVERLKKLGILEGLPQEATAPNGMQGDGPALNSPPPSNEQAPNTAAP